MRKVLMAGETGASLGPGAALPPETTRGRPRSMPDTGPGAWAQGCPPQASGPAVQPGTPAGWGAGSLPGAHLAPLRAGAEAGTRVPGVYLG